MMNALNKYTKSQFKYLQSQRFRLADRVTPPEGKPIQVAYRPEKETYYDEDIDKILIFKGRYRKGNYWYVHSNGWESRTEVDFWRFP